MNKLWTCKIGESSNVAQGADQEMRAAVAAAYLAVTGEDAKFVFSGWGDPLTEAERAVVDNREPNMIMAINDARARLLSLLRAVPENIATQTIDSLYADAGKGR